MAKRRLSVRKIKEVFRLHYEKGFSTRQIAKSLGVGRSTCGQLSSEGDAGVDEAETPGGL